MAKESVTKKPKKVEKAKTKPKEKKVKAKRSKKIEKTERSKAKGEKNKKKTPSTRSDEKLQKAKKKIVKNGKATSAKTPLSPHFLPGQTKETPDDNDSRRIFYQSLYEENKNSEMAKNWLLNHGLLPVEVAKQIIKSR